MSKERDVAVEYFNSKKESLRGEVVKEYESLAADIIRKKYFDINNFDDLMQEASLAILKALDKFDPSKGSFITLAHYAINRNIIMYLKKNCIYGNYRNKRERVSDEIILNIPAAGQNRFEIVDAVNNIFSKMDKKDVDVIKSKFGMKSGKTTHYSTNLAVKKFKNIAARWGLKSSDFHSTNSHFKLSPTVL